MTGPEEPDNLTSMESATETIKRIFEGSTSPVGAQIADESTRYKALEHAVCPKPAQTRLIAVANQKGGVGKTTSAVNLSAALARFGCKVLLIDMDPQGNASTALGAPHASGQPSVYDVIEGRKRIAEVKCTCPDFDNLDVVPASIDLSGAELEVADMADRNSLLKNAVDEFLATSEEHYDYVIIDCPPSLGLLVINAMCAVHEMLIPIQAEYYALEGLGQLINTIGLVQEHYNPSLLVSTMRHHHVQQAHAAEPRSAWGSEEALSDNRARHHHSAHGEDFRSAKLQPKRDRIRPQGHGCDRVLRSRAGTFASFRYGAAGNRCKKE